MNFNLFQRRESTAAPSASPSDQSQPKGGSFGCNDVRVESPSAALSVAAFYRAVELRANTMSQLVMEYQKKRDSEHGGNYALDDRGPGRLLNYLLQVQPNPTTTWSQMIKIAEQQRIFQGNAVIYIEKNISGEIEALWLCTSAFLDAQSFTYSLTYNSQRGLISKSVVPAENVIHIRNTFSNDNGLTGVSTLRYASKALSLAATNDKLVKDNASKGGKLKLLVQEDKQNGFGLGRANKKELEKITTQLNEDIYAQDVVLLNNVAGVTPISQTMQTQEILESRKFSIAEIARYTGVPLIMLMHPQNETYKSPEAATQEFLLRTIQPLSHDWEQELNAKILGREGYPTHRFHFNDDSLMRLDPMGRANIGKVLLETGIKCVNELRHDYDLPAVEKGDTHYVSTNLAELGSEKLSKVSGASNNQPQGGQKGDEQ